MPSTDRRSGSDDLFAPLRAAVLRGLQGTFGDGPPDLSEYESPPGDPGLFGPGSLPWRVHADLPSMLVGGYCALMLQSLHPLAMAGVTEHSRFEENYRARLGRTARFIGGTTFGSTAFAERLIEEVRSIHNHVHGTAPDGRPYSANDPELLSWVHTAEVWSFLRAYQRHSLDPLVGSERDGYLRQVAEVAYRLGAAEVPRSVGEVRSYLAAVRPALAATPEALRAAAFLHHPPGIGTARELVLHHVVYEASVELLPGWARRMLRLRRLPGSAVSAPLAASGLGALIRWAIGGSLVAGVSAERAAAAG
ncbi:MAG TPA: oxygenase MpaB family protein [Acidimicrobiales bacterium]|nr:oxygenase MpaB family protein [Acidimicrobiales bacterium]